MLEAVQKTGDGELEFEDDTDDDDDDKDKDSDVLLNLAGDGAGDVLGE